MSGDSISGTDRVTKRGATTGPGQHRGRPGRGSGSPGPFGPPATGTGTLPPGRRPAGACPYEPFLPGARRQAQRTARSPAARRGRRLLARAQDRRPRLLLPCQAFCCRGHACGTRPGPPDGPAAVRSPLPGVPASARGGGRGHLRPGWHASPAASCGSGGGPLRADGGPPAPAGCVSSLRPAWPPPACPACPAGFPGPGRRAWARSWSGREWVSPDRDRAPGQARQAAAQQGAHPGSRVRTGCPVSAHWS